MIDDMLGTIGGRAAAVRAESRLTQDVFAGRFGLSLSTLKKFEGGHVEPGARTLCAYAAAGANLHWLLTGEGAMMAAQSASFADPAVDEVEKAVRATFSALDSRNLSLPPAKLAKMVLAAFKRLGEGKTEEAVTAELNDMCDLFSDRMQRKDFLAATSDGRNLLLTDVEMNALEVMRATSKEGRYFITAALDVASSLIFSPLWEAKSM